VKKITGNYNDVSDELRKRIRAKYGIPLTDQVSSIIVREVFEIAKEFILSTDYEKFSIIDLGHFKIIKKPERRLAGNIPNTQGQMLLLPERFDIRFYPSKKAKNFLNKDLLF